MQKKDLKVIGSMIFMGSASIGVMNNGVTPTRILEINDEIKEDNAKHFIHNFPEIPVVGSSIWEDPKYLAELKAQDYDLLYGNPPCSGLSLGVKGPQSHEKGPNCHQYRYMDIVKAIQPKAFMYENAPTLLTTGKPILDDFIRNLPNYKFTVIREYGMYHNVAMKRQRTFFIGWRDDVFPTIPTLSRDHVEKIGVMDVIGDLVDKDENDVQAHKLVPNRPFQELEKFFPLCGVAKGNVGSVNWVVCNEYEKFEPQLSEKLKKALKTQLWKQREGLGYWDKSSVRMPADGTAPSITGYSSFIHPTLDRQFTIREYARLMNFPDTFEILEDKQIIRHIAQGVPANYYQWASGNVIEALLGNRPSRDPHENTRVVFQHHSSNKATSFTTEEWLATTGKIKVQDVKEKVWELEV